MRSIKSAFVVVGMSWLALLSSWIRPSCSLVDVGPAFSGWRTRIPVHDDRAVQSDRLQLRSVRHPDNGHCQRQSQAALLPPFPNIGERRKKSPKPEKLEDTTVSRQWNRKSIPASVPRLSEVLKAAPSIAAETKTELPRSSTSPNRHKKQQKQRVERVIGAADQSSSVALPWKAGYYTSLKSQKKIKDAANDSLYNNKKNISAVQRATAVLETFLSIPSTKCNSANLVCALTLSAKAMGCEKTNDKLRSLLYRTCDILSLVLVDTTALSARQLCNVAWALAKHSDRDDRFLPTPSSSSPLATAEIVVNVEDDGTPAKSFLVGHSETWDLRYDSVGCPAQRVDATIDTIASQLTAVIGRDLRAAKEGELSMASWAFGILRRRRRPAGWQHGPQLGKISTTNEKQEATDVSPHLIQFQQWDSDSKTTGTEAQFDAGADSPTATDALFDAIGSALCLPLLHSSNPVNDLVVAKNCTDLPLRVSSCSWSELANVAWAFASHGRSCSQEAQELLSAISTEASRRLTENGQEAKQVLRRDIAQIIWSLGTLQADNYRICDSLIRFVDSVAVFTRNQGVNEFRKWSCADIVQVTQSLAHARIDEQFMLHSLYEEALSRLESEKMFVNRIQRDKNTFLPWEISILLWAQARLYLNETQGAMFPKFACNAIRLINSALQREMSFKNIGIGSQEQANIAWSLTVLELYKMPDSINLLESIFAEAATSCKVEGLIRIEHAHQLWQSLFLLEVDSAECVSAVPAWFRDCLRDKWYIEKSRPKISSARHLSLSETLNFMGVAHMNEHDEDIDVAIILKPNACWTHDTEKSQMQHGVRVAVEFDGPNHFTRQRLSPENGTKSELPRPLGHTVLKYRLLKKQGWTVVRVPYYEYDKIPFWASMERQRYLQRQLKTHGNLRFSLVDVSEYKAQVPVRGSRYD